MPSSAFTLFNERRKKEIMEMADVFEELNSGPGRKTKYALLNGALVLLVSSWEIYCEEVCRQAAQKIHKKSGLRFDQLSQTLRRELLKYAGCEFKCNKDPLDAKVSLLPDGGWKELISVRLEEYISAFNTPKFKRQNGKNLNELFRLVLGIKVSSAIEDFLQEQGLCAKLDKIVTLRGEIAHTGDTGPEDSLDADLIRDHTNSFIEAAAAIDVVIHRQFRNQFHFAPWQITKPVREALRESVRNTIQS